MGLLLVALILITFILMAVPLIIAGLIVFYALKLHLFKQQVLAEPEIDPTLFVLTDKEKDSINGLKLQLVKTAKLRNKIYSEKLKYEVAGSELKLSVNNDGKFSRRSKNGKIIQDNIDLLSSKLKGVDFEISQFKKVLRELEDAHNQRWLSVQRAWDNKVETLDQLFERFIAFSAALVGWFLTVLVFTHFITVDSLPAVITQYINVIGMFSGGPDDFELINSSTWVLALAFGGAVAFYFQAKSQVKKIDTIAKLSLSSKIPVRTP